MGDLAELKDRTHVNHLEHIEHLQCDKICSSSKITPKKPLSWCYALPTNDSWFDIPAMNLQIFFTAANKRTGAAC